VADSLEHDNEVLVSTKCWEFIFSLRSSEHVRRTLWPTQPPKQGVLGWFFFCFFGSKVAAGLKLKTHLTEFEN
jgi:hypothetical protein